MLNPKRIREAIKYEGGVSRRLFLAYGAALSSIPLIGKTASSLAKPIYQDDPFSIGVASGEPDHNSVVIWTRLATKPLDPGGGMVAEPLPVSWVVAEDDGFKNVVAKGNTFAHPDLGHTVHVEVQQLKPDRWYWYRFTSGDAESPIGRTRTMPAPDSLADKLRFAFTSCQHFEQGWFTPYEQMAKDEVDLVFHLGDYIYEYAAGRGGNVRRHLGDEINSLDDYRIRYSQYRTDRFLSDMHAKCPWFVTWDDHEFDNNCANDISEEKNVDPADFLIRRANAYRAYYEMMPLRAYSLPKGPDMQLYRNAAFGRLAQFNVLDTRQYRTDQPNNDRASTLNEAALAPENTLLGDKQKGWLKGKLSDSDATWNVLAQQVMMGMVGYSRGEGSPKFYSMDQWPGYAAERMEMMKFMAEASVSNPVVLTGDIHSNWANELRIDDRKPEQEKVGVEFVATSLTSGGNGKQKANNHEQLLASNPCIKFHNRERGYVLCDVTPETWTTDYIVCDEVQKLGGKSFSRAKFVVESGTATIQDA